MAEMTDAAAELSILKERAARKLRCCGRPMNPMRAGTGDPPRTHDELWCDTCGQTIRLAGFRHPPAMTETERLAMGKILDDAIEEIVDRNNAETPPWMPLPVRQPLTIAGRFRVYFAAHQYAPLVWSIATTGGGAARWGDDAMGFEIAVAELEITSGKVRTMYRPKATSDYEDGMPSAWIEVEGVLRIDPDSSTARIE